MTCLPCDSGDSSTGSSGSLTACSRCAGMHSSTKAALSTEGRWAVELARLSCQAEAASKGAGMQKPCIAPTRQAPSLTRQASWSACCIVLGTRLVKPLLRPCQPPRHLGQSGEAVLGAALWLLLGSTTRAGERATRRTRRNCCTTCWGPSPALSRAAWPLLLPARPAPLRADTELSCAASQHLAAHSPRVISGRHADVDPPQRPQQHPTLCCLPVQADCSFWPRLMQCQEQMDTKCPACQTVTPRTSAYWQWVVPLDTGRHRLEVKPRGVLHASCGAHWSFWSMQHGTPALSCPYCSSHPSRTHTPGLQDRLRAGTVYEPLTLPLEGATCAAACKDEQAGASRAPPPTGRAAAPPAGQPAPHPGAPRAPQLPACRGRLDPGEEGER